MDTINTATPAPQVTNEYPTFEYNGWTIKHAMVKRAVRDKRTGEFNLIESPTFLKVGHTASYEIGENEYLRYLAYSLNGNSWEGV
jgi:hypothetical protein